MKNVLDPLESIPGVRLAALVSSDGVPIDVRTRLANKSKAAAAKAAKPEAGKSEPAPPDANGKHVEERDLSDLGAEDLNALSALASSWLAEVTRAVAPLSWSVPKRLVLQAARGTLIVQQAPRAILLVVLEGGMRPEELRLPMGVAIARMERHLRAIEPKPQTSAPQRAQSDPPGIFPAHKAAPQGTSPIHATGNEVPEVPGE